MNGGSARQAVKALLLLGLLLAHVPMALASLLLLLTGRRRPSSTGPRGVAVVVPFEPGETSGGARALKDFVELLGERVNAAIVCVPNDALRTVKARIARLLVWPLPLPHQCRRLVLGDAAIESRLQSADTVIFEFISTALVLWLRRRPAAFVVLRDHEVLARKIAMEMRGASGVEAAVHGLRLAICYLVSLAIYLRTDRVIALTDEDRDWLVRFVPGIGRRTVSIPVPFREAAPARVRAQPVVPAQQLVMVANFFHAPNVDAVSWFVRECAPHLAPGFTLHLCGLDKPLDALDLAASPIAIVRHGFVDDVEAAVPDASLAVAPVVSGGGVRIKNLFLASLEKVIITTRLGNEGIGFVDGRHAIVADTGVEMARRINEVSQCATEIVRLGSAARGFVDDRFSPAAVLDQLERHVPLARKV